MANQYPCANLAEMAQIPEEALPRFLAELPHLLAEVRTVLGGNEILGALGAEIECAGATWIDDDAETITTSMAVEGAEGAIRVTRKFGGETVQ